MVVGVIGMTVFFGFGLFFVNCHLFRFGGHGPLLSFLAPHESQLGDDLPVRVTSNLFQDGVGLHRKFLPPGIAGDSDIEHAIFESYRPGDLRHLLPDHLGPVRNSQPAIVATGQTK